MGQYIDGYLYCGDNPIGKTDPDGRADNGFLDLLLSHQRTYQEYGIQKALEASIAGAELRLKGLEISLFITGLFAGGPVAAERQVASSLITRETAVIGPRATYRQFAKEIGANFLNVSDKAWTWAKNEKFLSGVVKRGDDVIFAGKFNPAELDPGSTLAREINYLIDSGYQWTTDFTKLIKQ